MASYNSVAYHDKIFQYASLEALNWELNPDGTPKTEQDKKSVIAAIQFLAENEGKVHQNAYAAIQFFAENKGSVLQNAYMKQLIRTDLSKIDFDSSFWKVLHKILALQPSLPCSVAEVPLVSLMLNGVEVITPKTPLLIESEYFRNRFSGNNKEALTNRIQLESFSDIDISVRDEFIKYIKTREINLTGDNIVPLYYLAKVYDLKFLETLTHDFIKKNILENKFKIESMPQLIHVVLLHDDASLIKTCTRFLLSHNSEIKPLEELIKTDLPPETKQFLEMCLSIKKVNINGFFLDAEFDKFCLHLSKVDATILVSLNRFCSFVPTSLKVVRSTYDELKFILYNVPNLRCLELVSYSSSTLPHSDRINSLKIIDGPSLESLRLNAEDIYVQICPALKEIRGPSAKILRIVACKNLLTIDVPASCKKVVC